MNFKRPPSSGEERIKREAIAWIVQRDLGLSPEQESELDKWLASDPRCLARFNQVEQSWDRFDPMTASEDTGMFERLVKSQAESARRKSWMRAAALAVPLAAAAIWTLFLWPQITPVGSIEIIPIEQSFSASQYDNQILPDGTIVEFNIGTRIHTRFSSKNRIVWLEEGEAHFNVAKDPSVPFIVYVGKAEIRAIGTAFNVRRTDAEIDVFVTEGRVRFTRSEAPSNPLENELLQYSEELNVSQRTTYSLHDPMEHSVVSTLSQDEMARLLAWKPENLEFSATPLGDILVALNKRNEIQLILEDEDLAAMRIEASFRSDNIENFVRLLEMTFGIKGEPLERHKILLRKPE